MPIKGLIVSSGSGIYLFILVIRVSRYLSVKTGFDQLFRLNPVFQILPIKALTVSSGIYPVFTYLNRISELLDIYRLKPVWSFIKDYIGQTRFLQDLSVFCKFKYLDIFRNF